MTEESQPAPPAVSRARVTVALLAVLVLLEAVALAYYGNRWRDLGHEEELGRGALAAARQAAVTITSLDHTKLDAQFKDIAALSTGAFRSEFQRNEATLRKEITSTRTVHVSTVREAAVADLEGERATVVVALEDRVTTAKVPAGRPLPYRMLLTLVHRNGSWLVENVRPVA